MTKSEVVAQKVHGSLNQDVNGRGCGPARLGKGTCHHAGSSENRPEDGKKPKNGCTQSWHAMTVAMPFSLAQNCHARFREPQPERDPGHSVPWSGCSPLRLRRPSGKPPRRVRPLHHILMKGRRTKPCQCCLHLSSVQDKIDDMSGSMFHHGMPSTEECNRKPRLGCPTERGSSRGQPSTRCIVGTKVHL